MKNIYRKGFNNINSINNNNNNNRSRKILQKYEHFYEYNNNQNMFLQNKISNNLNYKNDYKNLQPTKINNQTNYTQNIKMTNNISTKKQFNYTKNINPTRMQYNSGVNVSGNKKKKIINNNYYMNEDNNLKILNNQNNSNNMEVNKSIRNSLSMSTNNNSKQSENSKKRMGISQMNFYNRKNNMNYFPDIHSQRPNLNNINDNWIFYSHQQQQMYNDFINNVMEHNPHNIQNDNFLYIYDFEYKRPEEKLKKGQNQLIFEKLQKKYVAQLKEKSLNMQRTKTGFYQKNNNNKNKSKGRQKSAQDNMTDNFKGMLNINNKLENNFKEKNDININKEKISIDASKSNNKEKIFNKTYNGFNIKKNNKEKRKKERIILIKLLKYFDKKMNYFWVKHFNKKIKKKKKEYEEENENNKKNKSFDNYQNLIYPKIIKKYLRVHLINNNKRIYYNKNYIKYNTDNSEIDEIKEYKKFQKKLKNGKSDYANYIKTKNNYKEEDKNEYSSESDIPNKSKNKKEPQFRGLFDEDKNNKNNNKENNEKNNINNEKKQFKFKTTSNFYNKNNNNFKNNINENQNEKNDDDKKEENKKCKDDFDKEKKNRFNIENIINNVIENNKRAAAARSSTSFYNIGSHFMNNHMRSTKTKFYNPKEKRGGTFTGTKDSNFTKEQANEGKFNKPNSLKITLINPINWRKHEEIWDNLISINMGLAELEKYLLPPNETDILVSSYLKMNPKVLNFCSIQKINTSNTKNENNFISFMVDDNIQNPKIEIKKWKEAYKRVIFRWHPDKLNSILEEIKLKNEQLKNELRKKSSLIINNTNTLYKNLMEILNKILSAKNTKDNEN